MVGRCWSISGEADRWSARPRRSGPLHRAVRRSTRRPCGRQPDRPTDHRRGEAPPVLAVGGPTGQQDDFPDPSSPSSRTPKSQMLIDHDVWDCDAGSRSAVSRAGTADTGGFSRGRQLRVRRRPRRRTICRQSWRPTVSAGAVCSRCSNRGSEPNGRLCWVCTTVQDRNREIGTWPGGTGWVVSRRRPPRCPVRFRLLWGRRVRCCAAATG